MKIVHYFLALIILIVCACEEKKLEPISKSLGKPGTVEILEQEEIPGGVIITYRIPDTEDILSVKAEYLLSDGRKSESTASFYENTLTIAGFGDMQEHEAKIYVINRAQERSDPVTIKFTPLEASFHKVAKTMQIVRDFGGARFTWENPDKALLTFEFLAQDSLGSLQAMRIFTSSSEEMKLSLRGYLPEAQWFAAVIRDYWDNADTIFPPEKIIPIFEEKIDKSKMLIMRLYNDTPFTGWDSMDENIIDDDRATNAISTSYPASISIDLGVTVRLSRFLLFHRADVDRDDITYYWWGNWRSFDVYVCYDTPNRGGDWSEWTKIGECEVIKPSGLVDHTMTDEDRAFGEAGFEFEFDPDLPPFRYFRIYVKTVFGGTTFSESSELDFYGEIIDED